MGVMNRRSTVNLELLGATKETVAGWVGRKVRKPSGKKFKSGLSVNTVKSVVDHPVLSHLPAFTFHEDDSVVEARRCELVPVPVWKKVAGPLMGLIRRRVAHNK